ncbi:flagellar motor protein MotB [Desulforamulus ruminis]|uniref:OmpA/MotB domain protein n=1 Tax=Desulforamulus ruminis (strain ATCC 23193 / DSM 2154 / NCIMB 8452 / DL) TaxID=696281 RepID=F6DN22_DESRL|nr:flagellar motor protein MotB [Desulforamulus ruminis]AEG59480.1 OmpA/MotB domain protein [Desulforamulus ruminis DSM 2154]
MKKRGRGEAEKENSERWLITYSDLITLLLIFFIVMYSLSKIDASKYQAIASSLAKTMGGSSSVLDSGGASVAPGVQEKELNQSTDKAELENMENIRRQIQEYVDESGLAGKVTVGIEERGVVVSFQDVVLFPLGVAELSSSANEIVDQVGGILKQTKNYIRVEGHTDDLPINTYKYPSNWELSLMRSASVVHRLVGYSQIPADRLSATGYGEYRPRMPNNSDLNRQQNRRVDIVILRTKFQEVEPEAVNSQTTQP